MSGDERTLEEIEASIEWYRKASEQCAKDTEKEIEEYRQETQRMVEQMRKETEAIQRGNETFKKQMQERKAAGDVEPTQGLERIGREAGGCRKRQKDDLEKEIEVMRKGDE